MASLVLAGVAACAPEPVGTAATASAQPIPRNFDLVALSGESVSSRTTLGRSTIVIVITTYDIPSQYVAREVATLVRSHRPRVNAVGVVLEPPRNAPLVETFATLLELPFPLSMGDDRIRAEDGPFGGIAGVPTILVLDPRGREVWRSAGLASARDIEAALSTAEAAGGI